MDNNNQQIFTLLKNTYELDSLQLDSISTELTDGDCVDFGNSTLTEHIKKLLNNLSSIENKQIIKNQPYNNITENGIYIFDLEITNEENPHLPIGYHFCYIHDKKPYIIHNFSSRTKMFLLHQNINTLLTNIDQQKLNELFRPEFYEEHFFENIVKVDNIFYDYYSF